MAEENVAEKDSNKESKELFESLTGAQKCAILMEMINVLVVR